MLLWIMEYQFLTEAGTTAACKNRNQCHGFVAARRLWGRCRSVAAGAGPTEDGRTVAFAVGRARGLVRRLQEQSLFCFGFPERGNVLTRYDADRVDSDDVIASACVPVVWPHQTRRGVV